MSIATLLDLFGQWGASLLFVVLLFGAIGAPLPSSILLVTTGALMAQGEIAIWTTGLAALAGAVLGDQAGYAIGRLAGRNFVTRLSAESRTHLAKAERFAEKWGGVGVFLSRWLVSPLGPYINLTAAIAGYPWAAFTLYAVTGEMVWVMTYAGAGYLVGYNVETLTAMLTNGSWMIAAAMAVLLLGLRMKTVLSRRH